LQFLGKEILKESLRFFFRFAYTYFDILGRNSVRKKKRLIGINFDMEEKHKKPTVGDSRNVIFRCFLIGASHRRLRRIEAHSRSVRNYSDQSCSMNRSYTIVKLKSAQIERKRKDFALSIEVWFWQRVWDRIKSD
jgi:hypothetical protein